MLNICPVILIVDNVDAPTPKNFLSTELNTAFVFGDEKSANPNPRKTRLVIMNAKLVSAFRNIKINNPMVVISSRLRQLSSAQFYLKSFLILVRKLPSFNGWETSIIPAVCGLNPFMY